MSWIVQHHHIHISDAPSKEGRKIGIASSLGGPVSCLETLELEVFQENQASKHFFHWGFIDLCFIGYRSLDIYFFFITMRLNGKSMILDQSLIHEMVSKMIKNL